jgi:methylthioribose-1-phosphate isomerase
VRVGGRAFRSIWWEPGAESVQIIDQTLLPHKFKVATLATLPDAIRAIETMQVRGAPLVGVTAAYGLALAMRADPSSTNLKKAAASLAVTRPTAVNLRFALDRMCQHLLTVPEDFRGAAAFARATEMADEEVQLCHAIGRHGIGLIRAAAAKKKGQPIHILTHCNAGWLASIDLGMATAPIYMAHDEGIAVHTWVDETRPRNQGASLTAWELAGHGVPHTIIVDNAGGHLMQHGMIDLVIVGTDRTTAAGDVCNKIGTYLKALAAYDNGVPFYAAVPSTSIDFSLESGRAIPIEIRPQLEVTHITGQTQKGRVETVRIAPLGSKASNYAFDVTPARLVTALITERGVIAANKAALAETFADRIASESQLMAAS